MEDALTSKHEHQGRLELTWTNKDKRLLAHEDGSYEWLSPADYRIAEVRLLKDVATVGRTAPQPRRATDNLLIRGDALNALTSLIELPEFASEYVGKVKLAYLDPPFNTQQSFLHYDDALEHSVWLTMMRDRLVQIKRLLSPDGSIWVHCDDYEAHRLRMVLDEVFGPRAFVATVIWQKRTSRDNRAAFSSMHDYIHVYAPLGVAWKDMRNRLPDEGEYANPDDDPRGPWRSIPMSAQEGHATQSQFYEIETPTGVIHNPPKGRAWTYTKPRFEELLTEGRIYWPKGGDGKPRLKKYPDEAEGLVPFTIWPASDVGTNDEAKKQILSLFPKAAAFETPKPERLMERIVTIGSDPGDVVLDCFLGSGTTAAVAQRLNRRWIGIERSLDTLESFAGPRLNATDDGSAGYRFLNVAPSMFEADGGNVFIADWASNGKLSEATAAQLGYEFESDPPFAGRKGRNRLAVIDGLVNADVARMLVNALPHDELLTLCGTAIDDHVRVALRDLRRGSTVRKIPASILADYRSARWKPTANGDR
jgi:adenine-specific DNA-methyltransferase